jgi:glycine cleavage system H protein
MSHEIKSDRRYTRDHEWAKADGETVRVGITAFAVEQLGDITLVNIDVAEGDGVEAGKAFGTVESVKTLADMFAPIAGRVVAVNKALEGEPELINGDCWELGWMIALVPDDPAALDGLLDHGAYAELLAAEPH